MPTVPGYYRGPWYWGPNFSLPRVPGHYGFECLTNWVPDPRKEQCPYCEGPLLLAVPQVAGTLVARCIVLHHYTDPTTQMATAYTIPATHEQVACGNYCDGAIFIRPRHLDHGDPTHETR